MPEPLVVISTVDAAVRSISQIVKLLREAKPGSGKRALEEMREEMASGFEALQASLEEARTQLQAMAERQAALEARVAELKAAEGRRRRTFWARLWGAFRKSPENR
ncbi:MAG: hypothetical protein ACK41F_10465 [Fimbriimonadaceae bacterium]